MITAEGTDRIDNLIHLPERHPIHLLVQLIEVCFNLLVVIGTVFVVAFIEHSQNRFTITVVGWVLLNVGFQGFKELFYNITVLLRFW